MVGGTVVVRRLVMVGGTVVVRRRMVRLLAMIRMRGMVPDVDPAVRRACVWERGERRRRGLGLWSDRSGLWRLRLRLLGYRLRGGRRQVGHGLLCM
jgi:hypothetical protein